MEAKFVQPQVDRDIQLTMKESEVKMYLEAIGPTSRAHFEKYSKCGYEAAAIPEKVYNSLSGLLR